MTPRAHARKGKRRTSWLPLVLVLGLGAMPASVRAQNIADSFTPYLNATNMREMVFDPAARVLWIASNGGALRYALDSGAWTQFPRLLGAGPRGNDLVTLCIAADGKVWTGSATRGFTFYDPATNSWDRFVEDWPDPRINVLRCLGGGIYIGTQEGLAQKPSEFRTDICNPVDAGCIVPSFIVNDFARMGDTLWVATKEGLGRWNGVTWDSANALPAGSVGQESRSLAVFQGTLWEASENFVRRLLGGVWQTTGIVATHLVVSDGDLFALQASRVRIWEGTAWRDLNVPLSPGTFARDLERIEGILFLATSNGLYVWPGGETTSRIVPPGPALPEPYAGLAVDQEGTVWVGTQAGNIGLLSFDGTRWEMRGPGEGLESAWIFRLLADRTGRIWTGHCCCDPAGTSCRLEVLTTGGFTNAGLINAWALDEDATGRIWAGLDKLGAAVVQEGAAGQWNVALRLTSASTGAALSTNTVRAIGVAPQGTYFGHFQDGGVDYWPHGGDIGNGADGSNWVHIRTAVTGLFDNNVGDIIVTGDDAWVGTASGIHRFRDGALQERCPSRLREVLEDQARRVNALAVDLAGGLWVGTDDGILYLARGKACDGGGGDFSLFTEDNSPLPNNRVLSIAVSPKDGNVWFGTQSGLLRVDPVAFSGAEPPPDRYVLYPNPMNLSSGAPAAREVFLGNFVAGLRVEPVPREALSRPEVFDLTGNKVAEFETFFGGRWGWRGKNLNGNYVAPGIYFVRTQTPVGEVLTLRLGVVR